MLRERENDMTTKTSKKTAAKTTKNVETTPAPTLKELINGTGDAVAKAVATKSAEKDAAPKTVGGLKVTKMETPKADKATAKKGVVNGPAKGNKLAKKVKTKKVTIAGVVKPLIEEGLSNEEIHERALASCPDYTDAKRWYISWYRSDMKRKAAKLAAASTKATKAAKKAKA